MPSGLCLHLSPAVVLAHYATPGSFLFWGHAKFPPTAVFEFTALVSHCTSQLPAPRLPASGSHVSFPERFSDHPTQERISTHSYSTSYPFAHFSQNTYHNMKLSCLCISVFSFPLHDVQDLAYLIQFFPQTQHSAWYIEAVPEISVNELTYWGIEE